MLLLFVFDQLKCARFTLSSSGPPILKHINKKYGVIFEIFDSGHIYCLPVLDGHSLDTHFRIVSHTYKKTHFSDQSNNYLPFSSPRSHSNNQHLIKDITCFLESLDVNFLKNCFESNSIAINNQTNSDIIMSAITHVLNNFY